MKLPKLKFHAATLRSQAEPFSNTPDVHPRWHLGRAHGVIIWIQEETADDLSGRSVKPVPGQGCRNKSSANLGSSNIFEPWKKPWFCGKSCALRCFHEKNMFLFNIQPDGSLSQ